MRLLTEGADIPDPMAPYLAVDRSVPRHECWVVGHMVSGLDGTARVNGRVGALSTDADQRLFRQMRQIADVVLVGAETVRRERYGTVQLSSTQREERRDRGQSELPSIAVVSRRLALDWTASVFADAPPDARPFVITCACADAQLQQEAARHADVIIAGDQSVEPSIALAALADRGHRVVLCEGGPHWLGQLVAADRLDELCLSVSPRMGGDDLPLCVTPPGSPLVDFVLRGAMVEDNALFLRYERL